ncbi:hypothetical protein [Streptomyces sp. NPDC001665]
MDAHDFVRMVGRRAALRYVLAGVAAAAVSACSGNGSTSVASRTVGAFVKGRWKFSAENGSGGWIDVFDDGQLLVFGGVKNPWSEEGAWSFKGGRLSATVERRAAYVVHDMPEQAERALRGDYTLSGGLIEGQDAGYAKMRVSGGDDKVVLTFPAYSDEEPRVVTCTRVKPEEAP